MSDTLRSISKSGENTAWRNSIQDKVKQLLAERERLVLEEGPKSPVVLAIDLELAKIVSFCDDQKIELMDKEDVDRRIRETERAHDEKVDSIRQAYRERYWRQLEERVAKEELQAAEKLLPQAREKAKLKQRKAAIAERIKYENLEALHLMPDEDPENCEIVYQGPVFRLINPSLYAVKTEEAEGGKAPDEDDWDLRFEDAISKKRGEVGKRKYSYNPFLLPTYFFGKHRACFHEQAEMPSDFMVGLRFDPADDRFTVKAIDAKVTIRKNDRDAFAPFMHSSYNMEEGDVVRLGAFHLVVERNHGYSMGALYDEAKSHLGEMLEIIFDTDKTTEAQDLEAYKNMAKVLACNLPEEKKQKLLDYVARVFKKNFDSLWAELQAWDAKMPMPDARKFDPLLMTLKQQHIGDRFFAFSTDATLTRLRAEALRRMPVCLQTDPLNEMEFAIWNVEMARFLETGLLEPDDFNIGPAAERKEDLQEILDVRKLIDALYLDEIDQLQEIMQLLQIARGKFLYDIYGADEIVIRNQDVDLKLSPGLAVVGQNAGDESFVAQIARKIARNAWVKLHQKRTAEERKNELNLIQALIDLGKVRPIHLVDFAETNDPLAKEKEIEAKLKELEEGIASSQRREALDKEEKVRARLLAERAFSKEFADRRQILDRSMDLIEKLHVLGEELSAEDLYKLLNYGDLFTDSQVTHVVQGCLEGLVEEPAVRQLADYEGRMTKVVLQIAPLKKSWKEVEEEWRQVVEENLTGLIKPALIGQQSCLVGFLLRKYIGGLADGAHGLSVDETKLERAQEMEQFVRLRAVVMKNSWEAGDWPDWLEGEDVREYIVLVDKIRLKLGERWMNDLLEKIRRQEAGVDRYCGLARNLLKAVPTLRYAISMADHDLLI